MEEKVWRCSVDTFKRVEGRAVSVRLAPEILNELTAEGRVVLEAGVDWPMKYPDGEPEPVSKIELTCP
jgi:hypothetical protein